MADESVDPNGNTEALRAFAPRPELATWTGQPVQESSMPSLISAVVVAAVLLTLAFWIALG